MGLLYVLYCRGSGGGRVNSKQKRIRQRYRLRFSEELVELIHEMLTCIKDGSTTVDKELEKLNEVKETLRSIK